MSSIFNISEENLRSFEHVGTVEAKALTELLDKLDLEEKNVTVDQLVAIAPKTPWEELVESGKLGLKRLMVTSREINSVMVMMKSYCNRMENERREIVARDCLDKEEREKLEKERRKEILRERDERLLREQDEMKERQREDEEREREKKEKEEIRERNRLDIIELEKLAKERWYEMLRESEERSLRRQEELKERYRRYAEQERERREKEEEIRERNRLDKDKRERLEKEKQEERRERLRVDEEREERRGREGHFLNELMQNINSRFDAFEARYTSEVQDMKGGLSEVVKDVETRMGSLGINSPSAESSYLTKDLEPTRAPQDEMVKVMKSISEKIDSSTKVGVYSAIDLNDHPSRYEKVRSIGSHSSHDRKYLNTKGEKEMLDKVEMIDYEEEELEKEKKQEQGYEDGETLNQRKDCNVIEMLQSKGYKKEGEKSKWKKQKRKAIRNLRKEKIEGNHEKEKKSKSYSLAMQERKEDNERGENSKWKKRKRKRVKNMKRKKFNQRKMRESRKVLIEEQRWNENINWLTLHEAIEESKTTDKLVMLLIHKTWCGACKALKPKFANSKEIEDLSKHFLMVNVEDDEEPNEDKYKPDGGYIPRIFFMRGDKVLAEIYNKKGNPKYKYYYYSEDTVLSAMKEAKTFQADSEDSSSREDL